VSRAVGRAHQTAEIVAEELGHKDSIVVDDALRPDASYEQFEGLLARHKDKDAIMVVGHNPSQTEFLNRLVTGTDREGIDFKKGAVARVDGEAGKPAVLKWTMPPKVVKAIQASAKSSRPKTVSK
jgi:phosphohistidine phosphatase